MYEIVELTAPLMKLTWLDRLGLLTRRFGIGGRVGTVLGEPPSKFSDSVTDSPALTVSRSKAAVNEAAKTGEAKQIAVANTIKRAQPTSLKSFFWQIEFNILSRSTVLNGARNYHGIMDNAETNLFAGISCSWRNSPCPHETVEPYVLIR